MYKQLNNEEALRLVMQMYNYSKDSSERTEFLADYDIGYKKYLMYKEDRKKTLEEKKQKWRSNVFVPMCFTIVETFVPHVLLSLIANDIIVSMKANNRDDFERASIAEKLSSIQALEDECKVKYEMFIKDAAIGGLSSGKVIWFADKIERMRLRRRQKTATIFGRQFNIPGVTEEVEEPYEAYRFNGPKLITLDPHDRYPDVSKTNIDDMRFDLDEFLLYTDEVEAYAEQDIFNNKDQVKALLEDEDNREHLSADIVRRMDTLDKTIHGTQLRSVLIKSYQENDRRIYVANDKYVLRNTDNPNWHKRKDTIDIKAIPIPHKYYSKSLVWTSNDMQNLANDTFNQKADNIRFLLNSMYTVVEDEILYNADLIPRPGGRIRVKTDTRAVEQVRHDNVTPDAYSQAAELDHMAQNASGIFNIVKGQADRKETATVGALLANAAGTRLQSAILRMAETFVKRHFMLIVELDRQYLTDERMIEIVGPEAAKGINDFRYISRSDMPQGKINYIPQVILEQKKEIDRRSSLDYFNLLYGKPEFDQYSLAEAVTQYMPYLTKSRVLLTREQYTERQDRIARQQESLNLKGINEEAVIPPVAGEVRRPGLPGVDQQMMSPEMARRKPETAATEINKEKNK